MNGGGPYILFNSDYNKFRFGEVVVEGTYAGCVYDDEAKVYYWLEADENWVLHDDAPDSEVMVSMTAAVWDRVRAGGTYTWNASGEYWEDDPRKFRLGGYAGDEIELMEI